MPAANPSPLAVLAQLVGTGMQPENLESQAKHVEALANATGYQSLRTLAKAFREMADDIRRDSANG